MDFKTTRDVFEYAIGKEKEAVAFYEELSKIESYNAASETFSRFAEEEKKHVKLFQDLLNNEAKTGTYEFKKIEDLKISDYLVDITYEPGMTYNDLLKLAMKREEKAYKFYSTNAQRIQDSTVAKSFEILAQEELIHKNILEKLYDDFLAAHDF